MPPHDEQYLVEEKSWSELLSHARLWRNISKKRMNMTLHHFLLYLDRSGTERVLALGGSGQFPQETIYTAPLTRSPLVSSVAKLTLSPYLDTKPSKGGPPPAELAALCERQRTTVSSGISSYEFDPTSSTLLYSDSTNLYRIQKEEKSIIGNGIKGCPLHAQLCPVDSTLVAFVANRNVHIDWKGKVIYSSSTGDNIINGCSSFIAQEELDRFTGMWWSPGPQKMLLYEQVDETAVTGLQFTVPGCSPTQPMKYPIAGTANAISTLRLIVISENKITDEKLTVELRTVYPWYEYLSRVGWLPDGSAIWALLLNRLQDRYALVLIPLDLFGSRDSQNSAQVVTLLQEQSEIWFNVDNLTRFLTPVGGILQFIHASDRDDHTHLFHYTARLDEAHLTATCSSRPITAGDWSVLKEPGLFVDEKRKHVYFVANKHHPSDANLYERMECELQLNPEIGFVCWESSLKMPPRCVFYRLHHLNGDRLPAATLQHLIYLPQPSLTNELSQRIENICTPKAAAKEYPELIEYQSKNSKRKHYALLLKPFGAIRGLQYPVIQLVYGGPGVQLVRNAWSTWVGFRKFASLGYAVLMVDGRGSSNRGISFEAALKNKLGTVEIEDQVEGLREVAKRTNGLLDLTRVAVMGWSYGGYLALLCLAKSPNVYRAAIAGGAVTCWRLYDTAYTERYLGLPSDPIYKDSSVLSYVNQLPNEVDRLLIVHGLIDENVHFSHTERLIEALIAAGKPHRLQIFPSERHGVRSVEAGEFHDASMLSFLCRALAVDHLHSDVMKSLEKPL
ncbi:CBR-DPF-3 protein [Loa loa]|uniref:CBR-DPF-3 protein n=2 Tax=Loa loa TaxID=7209 RepID=A0A1S0UH74_LOALO|nr:CBR-DPF-3 protein [Loa loa]EJD74718.1 CBR-DPF-3 protein [Loa loa]